MPRSHVIIVADTGSFRAFDLEYPPEREPFPRKVEALDLTETNRLLSEKVTDQAGAMPNGAAPGATSHTGNDGIILEDRSRAIKLLGGHIDRILNERDPEIWSFAAPSEAHQAILDAIPDRKWLDRLRGKVTSNLVNVREQEFGKHFDF